MPSYLEITPDKLARIIGTPNLPAIIDVRNDEDFASDPRLVPGSIRRDYRRVAEWGPEVIGSAIVLCQKGQKLGHGVAAHLRVLGTQTEVLEGGFEAWCDAQGLLVPDGKLPRRDAQGRTVWVTRSRPKIDRIACPWLIRRFVDPSAVFLFVPASEVSAVAERFGATPFDIENVFWSHRGELCAFDVMVEEFGLKTDPLLRLATIVRGADTARPDLAPEAPGLLAVSLGLSRMFNDDLEQLEAGLTIYDAFYRWCRDATDETHNWPNPRKG
ncbi:chromate resistance protein ChrB domain-containing protein [Rhizobium terrae]|uniref:chromate resistance protein ChrB domain-containing protein n=1 Tax=Rhizobium terrae TaxID=2171756 RepID=UPI000E3E8C7A|nr:sulfurtransferase/chromate resistance protein [Rhizobium terrae]